MVVRQPERTHVVGIDRQSPGYGAIARIDAIGDSLAPFGDPRRSRRRRSLPPFQGGAAGYIGYDLGRTLERMPASRYDDLAISRRAVRPLRLGDRVGSRRVEAWLISTGHAGRPHRPAERGRADASAIWGAVLTLSGPHAARRRHATDRRGPPRRHGALSSGASGCVGATAQDAAVVVSPRRATLRPCRTCATTSSPATSSRPTFRNASKRRSPSRRGRSTGVCEPEPGALRGIPRLCRTSPS